MGLSLCHLETDCEVLQSIDERIVINADAEDIPRAIRESICTSCAEVFRSDIHKVLLFSPLAYLGGTEVHRTIRVTLAFESYLLGVVAYGPCHCPSFLNKTTFSPIVSTCHCFSYVWPLIHQPTGLSTAVVSYVAMKQRLCSLSVLPRISLRSRTQGINLSIFYFPHHSFLSYSYRQPTIEDPGGHSHASRAPSSL